jgi:Uma2 family endonuclease
MEYSVEEKLLTEEDMYSLPDDDRHYELQAGQLISEPTPGGRHGRICANVMFEVMSHIRRHDLGVAYTNDGGYVLARNPDTVRGPDISFLRKARFEEVGDTPKAIPGPPDLAIEVLSPGDTRSLIHARVADYLAAGTPLVWIVDPERKQVTAYRELLAPRILRAADTLDGEDVLPGFSVQVGELFAI